MIKKIFAGIEIEVVQNKYGGDYNKVEYDSRKIGSGDIFVALEGENNDGHKHIDFAIQNGAKLIVISKKIELKNEKVNIIKVENTRKILGRLASNFYDSPEKKIKILGVTGTNGKTTTAYLLHTFLEDTAFIGSVGIEIGENSYPPVNTTPESLDIIKYAKEALEVAKGFKNITPSSYEIEIDRAEAIKKMVRNAESGDIILLTGKGHENYQEIKGIKVEYKEIEIVKNTLGLTV